MPRAPPRLGGHRQRLDDLLHDALRGDAGEARLRVHHHPMRDDGQGDLLHVLGRDEVAARRGAPSACAAFMSASEARGLAPSETPAAVRVACTRSTT